MTRVAVPQTPRRSQRFQPAATPSTSKAYSSNILECEWLGEPIHVRKADKELDFLPEEVEKYVEDGIDLGDQNLETVFYDAFKLKRKATSFRGTHRMKIAQPELQDYRVGSTVMVETDVMDLRKRPPSIGVIIALWQVREVGGEVVQDPTKMRIRIHWFLRPTEMAAVRATRQHEENEIYYCLDAKVTVTPTTILSRCAVSGIKGNTTKEKSTPRYQYIPIFHAQPPKTPSKSKTRSGSPVKQSVRPRPSESENGSDHEQVPDESGFSQDPDRIFYCGLAVDPRRGLFFNFDWDSHRHKSVQQTAPPQNLADGSTLTWGEGREWDVAEKGPTNEKRKNRKKPLTEADISESEVDDSDEHVPSETDSDDDEEMEAADSDEDEDREDETPEDDLDGEPKTPRKRRAGHPKTLRKRTKTLVKPTPHSKAALRKRKRNRTDSEAASPRKRKATFAIRYPEQSLTFQASMSHLPPDPWLRAMHALHVGSRPDVLPCREDEYARVLRCVGELLEEGSGGCVYISGVPGTGKTATVHTVVKELKRMAQNSETNPFTYVEINGLKIPEPTAAYSLLWEGISGHNVAEDGHLRMSSKESLKALTRYFTTGNRGPGGHACVVLMDELDQLVTSKQDVVYNFFNWPTLAGSKLVVIAVANTMDLPERVMTGRVRSRLGMIRINFQPYTREQLVQIIQARLKSAHDSLEEDEQAEVDIIHTDAIKMAAMSVSRITGDARRVLDLCRRAVELVKDKKGTVKAPHIQQVNQVMQNTPTAAYLRGLSFHERLMLTSLIKCIKREGIEQIKWGDLEYQHSMYQDALAPDTESRRKLTSTELAMVLESLESSRALIVEYGVAVSRKDPSEKRVQLELEQGEVEKVLGDIGGTPWKNILGN